MDKHGVLGLSWFATEAGLLVFIVFVLDAMPKLSAGAGHGLVGCTALAKIDPVVWVVVEPKSLPDGLNEKGVTLVDDFVGTIEQGNNPVALVDDISCWTSTS